jgi:hypothetical protein
LGEWPVDLIDVWQYENDRTQCQDWTLSVLHYCNNFMVVQWCWYCFLCCGFCLLHYDIGQCSETQFHMVDLEMRTSTQLHIALWTSKFCSAFYISIFFAEHTTLNLYSFQGSMFVVSYEYITLVYMAVGRGCLKCHCDNFKPQEVRRIKLFRIEKSRGWKNNFFIHFCVHLLLNNVMWVCLFKYPMCLLWS